MVNSRNKKTPGAHKRASGTAMGTGGATWMQNSFTSGPLKNVNDNEADFIYLD